MTLTQTQQALSQVKKGRMVKVHYVTKKGDYTKETKTIVRFVKYANIKGVVAKNSGNPNESHIINDMLIYNKNTNKYYLQMAVVKSNHKPNTQYFFKGSPITKADYELANKPSPSPSIVFKKNIDFNA